MKTTSERSLIGSVDYVIVKRVAIEENAEAFAHEQVGQMAIWVEPRSIVPISLQELVGAFVMVQHRKFEIGTEP